MTIALTILRQIRRFMLYMCKWVFHGAVKSQHLKKKYIIRRANVHFPYFDKR